MDDYLGVKSVDYLTDFDSMLQKVDKFKILYDKGTMDTDLLRYIPGLSRIFYQGQIDNIMKKNVRSFNLHRQINFRIF